MARKLVQSLKARGVNGAVFVDLSPLFRSGGPSYLWMQRYNAIAAREARRAAPKNKRPRWLHNGPPLSGPAGWRYSVAPGRETVVGAMGNVLNYALFVDQGTGVFGGKGAYPAKILPPWLARGYEYYERHWRYDGKRTLPTIMIKGQQGQHFMQKGMVTAALRMGVLVHPGTVPTPPAARAMALKWSRTGFVWSFAFDTQQRIWRAERDAAWSARRRNRTGDSAVRRQRRIREESQAIRKRNNQAKKRQRERYEKSRDKAKQAKDRQPRSVEAKIKNTAKGMRGVIQVGRIAKGPDGSYAVEVWMWGSVGGIKQRIKRYLHFSPEGKYQGFIKG